MIINIIKILIMKKLLLLLVCITAVSCDQDDTPLIDTSIEYDITLNNGTELIFNFQSLDASNDGFLITSYTPNTSCCLGGTFVTENTVNAKVDGAILSTSNIETSSNFSVSLDNFSEGMNYYTVQLDSGSYRKYFSFQFNLDNGVVDYLSVIKNSDNDNVSNYSDAIFRFDFYTDSSIRVLQQTEGGIKTFYSLIENETGTFSYITSGGATTILKTSKEDL